MSNAYLSLGANLGDRREQLAEALRRLAALPGIKLAGVSGLYQTAPQGKTDQPAFLNCAAWLETELAPLDLLAALQAVEQALGREREVRWGPRTIDIDLLLYDELQIDLPTLTVPHPRMWERAFVLIPLLDVLPDPALQAQLDQLPDQGVELFENGASFFSCVQGVE